MERLEPGSPEVLQPGHFQTETLSRLGEAISRSRNLRSRVDRAEGRNADLNLQYEDAHDHINYLLDMYFFEGEAIDLSLDEQPTQEIQQVESD